MEMGEMNDRFNNIPTFIALPVDSLSTKAFEKSEQYQIIKNAVIKTLSDGSMCVVEIDDQPQIQNEILLEDKILSFKENDIQSVTPKTFKNASDEVQNKTSPIYKCPKCKEVFNKIASYRKHMIWHRNIKKFKCTKCSAGYNVETNLIIHMAMHEEGKPTCPLCKISFQRLASLKSHLMLHQVEELYTCEECAAEFEKEEQLIRHLQNHIVNNSENNLICAYCNVQFDDHKSYKEHISHHIKVKKMVLSAKKPRKAHSNKEYPHVCSVCLKSFSRVSLLERHLRVHSGERPFICPHCNRGFNQKGTLQIHLSKHTGIKPFQCTLCPAKFNQKGNLRVHVEKTHTAPAMPGVKMYKCSHCTCIFKKVASLNVHMTKSHAAVDDIGDISNIMTRLKELEEQTGSKAPNTEQNKKVLNEIPKDVVSTSYVKLAESFLDGTVRQYVVMQKKVNDVRLYVCTYCNKEFKKPSDLIRHTRVHTREKPFVCKQCGASFSLKSTLFCHTKTHSSNSNYVCTICMKKFSSMRSLNSHLRKHSDKQNQPTKTDDRVEIFLKPPLLQTPNGLQPIIKSPDSTKQFQCQICNVKFKKMPNLNRHMQIHSGEKKFKCDHCLKSYSTACALREHLRYHSGVKNFSCKSCGKRYLTSSLLKRHMISHNLHKPYVCPYCNKNFKSSTLCKKHINIHKKGLTLQVNDTLHGIGELQDLGEHNTNGILPEESNKNNTLNCQGMEEANENPSVSDIHILQQLDQVPSHMLPVLNIDKAMERDSVQTIFVDCNDVHFSTNSQNSDPGFFTSLTDLQDANVFNVESFNDPINTHNMEMYDNNQIFNINQAIAVEDISADKILKSNLQPKIDKPIVENTVDPDVGFYTHSELNLFNVDSELGSNNNCTLGDDNLGLPDVNITEKEIVSAVENDDTSTKKTLTCDKCNKVFTNRGHFSKHVSTHSGSKKNGVKLHHCSFCSKGFKKQSDLIRHIRTHTGEKPFACDKCDKRFSLKSTLLSHQRTHNPVSHKRYSCVVCNSFFTSKSSLKVHMSVHTGDKTHECNFCPMKFRTAAHRKSHETNHHTNPMKKKKNKVTNLLASVALEAANQQPLVNFQNDQVVNEELENILVVQEPLSLNDGELNLLEETNPNLLTDSNQLEPIIIQQFQSNFLLTDSLMSSSVIHLDDGTILNVKYSDEQKSQNEKTRNFECEHCGKKYASKDVLRRHKKSHGVNKKFPCSKCDKGFDLEEELEKHIKTHVGFRPYSCMYCSNSFSKEHCLTTHMKRIHNISVKDDNLLLYDAGP